MHIRVTDQQCWAFITTATSEVALSNALNSSLSAWQEGLEVDPGVRYQRRCLEVERWLQERLSRPGVKSITRDTWKRQAEHWRRQARARRDRERGDHLVLHLRGDASKDWLNPGNNPRPMALDEAMENPGKAWQACLMMFRHDENIAQLSGLLRSNVSFCVLDACPGSGIPGRGFS